MWKQVGFWRLFFIVFPVTAVTLDTNFAISGVQPIILQACCLHVPTLGTVLSAWGHPGGPWEQQEGHVWVRSKIFSDFGLILGPHFESFLSSDGFNSVFLLELVSRSFFASNFRWNY